MSAYTRIYMSQFKQNHNYELYYFDTDSIDINKPFSSTLVISPELGNMKA